MISKLFAENAVWIVPLAGMLGAAIVWLGGWGKRSVDVEKTLSDIRIKEDRYEAEKYDKLLKRVIESDLMIEDLTHQIQVLSKKLIDVLNINKEIIAELNLYKTIK